MTSVRKEATDTNSLKSAFASLSYREKFSRAGNYYLTKLGWSSVSPLDSTMRKWHEGCNSIGQTKWRASGRFRGSNGQRSFRKCLVAFLPQHANTARLAIPSCQHRASREPWAGDPVSDQLHFPLKINTSSPQYACDFIVIEASGIIFHTNRALVLIELDLADSVDFPGIVERQHLSFAGGISVFENDIEQSHWLS
jgi:hypothetical protein